MLSHSDSVEGEQRGVAEVLATADESESISTSTGS